MFKFHIIGYEGRGTTYWSSYPVDIKVFAESQEQAIAKAEKVIGGEISTSRRRVYIEEMVGADNG